MTISGGTRLGPYEILAPLGAGGMGEVYRAKDTRLDRTVAIKVLPAHLSANIERRQRFEREARAVSSLSHPHICSLFDIGHQDGVDYLVMEFIEGETLENRLDRGAMPTDQVLRYGIQIADALDKAHKQGVVHRDLKPGNIMLTKSGAKLLDFGLAKLRAPESGVMVLSELPTERRSLTAEGTIMGTCQYMPPEQLEGKEVDARTDIFAFGSVLYEMSTGKKAFTGKSQASLITAIMSSEPPPISSIQPLVPPALDRVVKTCLAKDPDDRWQSAGDIKRELEWLAETSASAGVAMVPTARARKALSLYGVAATVVALALVVIIWRQWNAPRTVSPVVRFTMTLPPGEPLALTNSGIPIAFAPDGRRIAFVVRHGDTTALAVREIASFESKLLPGTEGAALPFFSPDGEWLGFFAAGKLRKIPVSGGPAIILCNTPQGNGATWLPDGTIVLNADWREGLQRVSAAGGTPEVLTRPDLRRGELYHWWPDALPGGEVVLFTDQKGASRDQASVAVLSLKTREWRTLIEKGSNPHYLPSGHIVYEHDGALLAVPFDVSHAAVIGPPFPVLQGVYIDQDFEAVHVAVARDGSIAYVPGTITAPENTLVVVDRAGSERPLTDIHHSYEDLTLSPDGRFLALTIRGEPWSVWLYDLRRDTLNRLTFEGDNRDPIWTADGKRVIYISFRNGRFHLLWKPIDGSSSEEELAATDSQLWPYSCSRDGRWLSYNAGNIGYLLPLVGERKPKAFVSAPSASGGAISPDGKWIAYESSESGESEVYVQPLSSGTGKWQISTAGGLRPYWSPDGRELFFRSGSFRGGNTLMSAVIQTEPVFSAGTPQPLFTFRYEQAGHDYAVMPDGRHFICIKRLERETGASQVNVILNWAAELKK
jgi:Tol biopolymer transport system component